MWTKIDEDFSVTGEASAAAATAAATASAAAAAASATTAAAAAAAEQPSDLPLYASSILSQHCGQLTQFGQHA